MKKHSLLVTLLLSISVGIYGQSLKPAEVFAKHAESLGTKEKRAELTTLMAIGLSEFETSAPAVKGGGRAIVVSNPGNLFFAISLNSREYPLDRIGYFDGKPSLPFINAGNRSLLGAFLNQHHRVLSDGLFGGVMALRWPAWHGDPQKMKSTGASLKKIGDRRVYLVEIDPGSGGSASFSIKLFFDAETFRHVRTEYRYELQSGAIKFGQQNQIASSVATLTEDFLDFKAVDGLTLPHRQRIEFSSNSGSGSYKSIWGVNVMEYRLNQKLDPGFFTFDEKTATP